MRHLTAAEPAVLERAGGDALEHVFTEPAPSMQFLPDEGRFLVAARSEDAADAPVQFYASIAINREQRGIFLVTSYAGGDFAVREEDLDSIGIGRSGGRVVMLEGEPHVMLSTMEDTSFSFDERSVHIDIEVDPTILTAQVVDARRRPTRANVEYPQDASAFFNYGLSDDDGEFESRVFAAEVGARHGNFLLLTDGFYERLDDVDRTVRLNSSLTYDNRDTLQQAVLGDFVTGSGVLGSPLNLGGISFSKNYRIDPYFTRYPFASTQAWQTPPQSSMCSSMATASAPGGWSQDPMRSPTYKARPAYLMSRSSCAMHWGVNKSIRVLSTLPRPRFAKGLPNTTLLLARNAAGSGRRVTTMAHSPPPASTATAYRIS
jgi:hypothetical protein